MTGPSPQERPPVDCRACRHCFDVRAGRAFRCGRVDGSTWIPWHLVASDPCDDFDPKPATASHPVSTDLEGTDLLKALSPLLSQLPSLRLMELVEKDGGADRTAGACLTFDEVRDLRRAISSKEARRARPPVEDPRDALLRQCAEFFSSSAYKWTLEAATDRRIATAGLMLDEFNEVAAALRAAGVEPKP